MGIFEEVDVKKTRNMDVRSVEEGPRSTLPN